MPKAKETKEKAKDTKETKEATKETAAQVKQAGKGATLVVDGKEYVIADLSAEAKACLQGIRFTDDEVRRLNMMLSVAKTARQTYKQQLLALLPK